MAQGLKIVQAGLLAGSSLLSACASFAPQPEPLPLVLPQPQAADASLLRHCSALPSPPADALLQQLAQQNLDLRTALARVRVARAQAAQQEAARLPAAQVSVQASRSKSNLPQLGPIAGGPIEQEQYEASVAAEYEVDVWNRIGKSVEAARWQVAAQRMDAYAAAVSVSAQLLENWYDLGFQLAQRGLIEDQVQTSRQLLELLKQRFVQGASPVLDVLQQKQQLAALETALAENRSEIALRENQIAVLLGRAPRMELDAQPRGLPELEAIEREQAFTASALGLRPDLRAGFYQVQAADARLAAAMAQRLPSVRLSGAIFGQGEDLSGVVDGLLWRIAGSLVQPLFDGGRITAGIDEAEAARAVQFLQYRQLLLTALRELSNAWIAEEREAIRIAQLGERTATAARSYELARQQYLRGAVDFLRVLNTLQSLQELEQQLLAARRQRISLRIQFCRALGANWLAAQLTGEVP